MKKAAKPKRDTNLTLADVSKIIAALPDTEELTSERGTTWKVKGKRLAGTPTHKSAEPHSLGVRISFDERERLIASQPDIYYITPHYVNYPALLVRLNKISREELRNLLGIAAIAMVLRAKSKRTVKAGN